MSFPLRHIIYFLFILTGLKGQEANYLGFENINPKNNRVIFIGDTQITSHWEFWRERNEEKTQALLNEIARRQPAFVVNLGDLLTRGASEKHWGYFDEFHKPLLKNKIPYFPVLGNHNYYGDNKKSLKYYFTHFPYLKNQKWYSFTFRSVGFLMLDGNYLNLSKTERENEVNWYQRELKRMEADLKIRFIITCSHRPPFTNSKVISASKWLRQDFAEPFQKTKKASFFFTGHCHSYEKFLKGGKYFIVSGGGGGPRHRLETNKSKRHFNDLFDGPSLRFFHFCEMKIQRDKLVVQVIKLNDNGTFSIADEISF